MHTIGLCDRARAVTAVDSRIENVAKTILRCYLYGHSPDIRRCNVEVADELAQLPDVDVVHHVGVLYHLVDPVAHLELLNRKVRLGLMLDTHVAAAEHATETDWSSGEKEYPCKRFNEGGVAEVFSGMYGHASWLTLETLMALLDDLGFSRTELIEQRAERNGPRVLIMAHRNAWAAWRALADRRRAALLGLVGPCACGAGAPPLLAPPSRWTSTPPPWPRSKRSVASAPRWPRD